MEKRALARAANVASGKHLRPEQNNTAAPTPAPEDLAAPDADRMLARLQIRWCDALTRAGKSPTTVSGYRADVQKACDHLGETTLVADLTASKVQGYFESDRVTKTRSGKPAAKPGVDKTRRAFRMALEWAVAAGWITGIGEVGAPEASPQGTQSVVVSRERSSRGTSRR